MISPARKRAPLFQADIAIGRPRAALGKGRRLAIKSIISIIDDDESLQAALIEVVTSHGYDSLGFQSAEAFLASGAIDSFSCVVTDVHLPGMSGIQLKHNLTALNYSVPVIMITARTEPGLEESARAAGAICFLRKPFEAEVLIDCIEEATSGHGKPHNIFE